jgi:tetratricopeptide (TPR) repeat protein
MRHALDPDLTMGLWFGHTVNWGAVKRGLAAIKDREKRLVELRKILEKHPDDPAGRNLLVAVLFDNDEIDEARAEATRLKRDGLATPVTLAILCDLQAAAGMEEEARRSCSELVEFRSEDPLARQRLGDLFLRHGWYGAAYRQYRTLVEVLGGAEPAAQLRLAAAAAGMGKIDEALRIERKVAAGEGEPGPDDPRRWARLHSAVKLSRMILAAEPAEKDKVKALTRSLKRTQVAGTPTTMVVLVWEDLEAALELVAQVGDEPFSVADRVASPWTGLMMLDVGESPPADLELSVKLRSAKLKRAVGFSLITITWDGKRFTLEEQKGELPAESDELALAEPAPAEAATEEG